MATARNPKYKCTVKVYSDEGMKLETQGTRSFGMRAIYLSMTAAEKKECREIMDLIDAKEK